MAAIHNVGSVSLVDSLTIENSKIQQPNAIGNSASLEPQLTAQHRNAAPADSATLLSEVSTSDQGYGSFQYITSQSNHGRLTAIDATQVSSLALPGQQTQRLVMQHNQSAILKSPTHSKQLGGPSPPDSSADNRPQSPMTQARGTPGPTEQHGSTSSLLGVMVPQHDDFVPEYHSSNAIIEGPGSNIGWDVSIQRQHLPSSGVSSTSNHSTHSPNYGAHLASQEDVQNNTSSEDNYQSSLHIREVASREASQNVIYHPTRSVSLSALPGRTSPPNTTWKSPVSEPLQTMHGRPPIQKKPVGSPPSPSKSLSMSAVPQSRPTNIFQEIVSHPDTSKAPGGLSTIMETGTPQILMLQMKRNQLDPKNMQCTSCSRLIYSGEPFDGCLTCFTGAHDKTVQFCGSCREAAVTHLHNNAHLGANSRILRTEGVKVPYICPLCRIFQDGSSSIFCGVCTKSSDRWCEACYKAGRAVHHCGRFIIHLVFSEAEAMGSKHIQNHLAAFTECCECRTMLGVREAFYTCVIRWAHTKSIFGAEDSALCQLCYDALRGQVPKPYECCHTPNGLRHRMVKSIVLVHSGSSFPNQKCKVCSKKDQSGHSLFLSCLNCSYVFCEDCYKDDLVLSHSKCVDPAYQVLISPAFFDIFCKPAGTCSSCRMTFPRALSFGRCIPCARDGIETLFCYFCLGSDGRRLQHVHSRIHVDVSRVEVRFRKYKKNLHEKCSECNSDYKGHVPFFKCNTKGCAFISCPGCFSVHSAQHEHRLFTVFHTVEVPEDVVNGPSVVRNKAQKDAGGASPDRVKGKRFSLSRSADSVINTGLVVGIESAVALTTGVSIRIPRLDYIGFARKAIPVGKSTRKASSAAMKPATVRHPDHTQAQGTSPPVDGQPPYIPSATFSQPSATYSHSSVLHPLAGQSPFVMNASYAEASITRPAQTQNLIQTGNSGFFQSPILNNAPYTNVDGSRTERTQYVRPVQPPQSLNQIGSQQVQTNQQYETTSFSNQGLQSQQSQAYAFVPQQYSAYQQGQHPQSQSSSWIDSRKILMGAMVAEQGGLLAPTIMQAVETLNPSENAAPAASTNSIPDPTSVQDSTSIPVDPYTGSLGFPPSGFGGNSQPGPSSYSGSAMITDSYSGVWPGTGGFGAGETTPGNSQSPYPPEVILGDDPEDDCSD